MCSRNLCKETISPLRLLTSLHWKWFKSSQLIQKQISQLKTFSPRGTIISEADVILKSRQSHSVFGLISSATLETDKHDKSRETRRVTEEKDKLEYKWKMFHKKLFNNSKLCQIVKLAVLCTVQIVQLSFQISKNKHYGPHTHNVNLWCVEGWPWSAI